MLGVIYTIIMMFIVIKKEKMTCNYNESKIIALMSLACLVICMRKLISTKNSSDIIYVIFFSWIMILAYIDNMCGYVYEITEHYGLVIVIMCIVKIYAEYKNEAVVKLIMILLSVLLFYFAARCKIFGMGDADVFAVSCLIFTDFYLNMLFYGVTIFLFCIRNIKELIINKGRLKDAKPLIPSIYMTYVLFIPFLL